MCVRLVAEPESLGVLKRATWYAVNTAGTVQVPTTSDQFGITRTCLSSISLQSELECW